jgi:membrane protein DedA with SNARE-associated domain
MSESREAGIRNLRSKIIAIALVVLVVALVLVVVAGDIIEDAVIEGTRVSLPPLTNVFTYIVEGSLNVIKGLGYYGVFALMVLESSSLPIPSEVILPFSGYLASRGDLNLWLIVAFATIAGMVGSLIDYYLGSLLGLEGVRKLRVFSIKESQLKSVVKWFDTYGALAVFGSRLIPVFRTLISFPAGIVRMPTAKFLLYTGLGCLLWNAILTYAGFYAGIHWSETVAIMRPLSIIAIAAIPSALIAYHALTKRRHRHDLSTQ